MNLDLQKNESIKNTARLSFIRHGEKDDSGNLTSKGLLQARQRGMDTRSLEKGYDIMLFHSGVGRVRDTVIEMAKYLGFTDNEAENYTAGLNIVDYVSPNLQYLHNPEVKGAYFSKWDDIELTEENISKRMKQFLSYDEPEPGIAISAKKMAQNIAQMIGIQVRFANMTDMSHTVHFVNGTHEPVVMAFIYYLLNDFDPQDVNFIDGLGGPIDYAEGFDINVFHTDNHRFDVVFEFREHKKVVDLDKLRAFAYST